MVGAHTEGKTMGYENNKRWVGSWGTGILNSSPGDSLVQPRWRSIGSDALKQCVGSSGLPNISRIEQCQSPQAANPKLRTEFLISGSSSNHFPGFQNWGAALGGIDFPSTL